MHTDAREQSSQQPVYDADGGGPRGASVSLACLAWIRLARCAALLISHRESMGV